MVGIARNVDATEIAAAANYFSQQHFRPWIRVIETRRVPRTRVVGWMYQPIPAAGTEPPVGASSKYPWTWNAPSCATRAAGSSPMYR